MAVPQAEAQQSDPFSGIENGLEVERESPYPLDLLSLTAKPHGNDGILEWITSFEENSDHFVVERSLDGMVFSSVTRIPAAVISIENSFYSYTDFGIKQLNVPNLYYRLKLVDLEGAVAYSETVELNLRLDLGFGLTIFPNPTTNKLYIRYESKTLENISLTITNMKGQAVWEREFMGAQGLQELELSVKDWPVGLYYVSLSNGLKSVTKELIVK